MVEMVKCYSSSWETHLRATERHPPYGITQCYLPPEQVNAPRLNPSYIGRYSYYLPRRDGRLSWPRRLVAYRNGLPARRQSPIRVLIQPGVEQLRWSDETRYRYATPPTQYLY